MIVNIYVPTNNEQLHVVKGSAIVGIPIEEDLVKVYLEGNLYNAANLHSYKERVLVAALRLRDKCISASIYVLRKDELSLVGQFNTESNYFFIKDEALLLEWESGYTNVQGVQIMSYFLKHLQNLNKAGWQCDVASNYGENPMPMACFYIFYPSTDEVIHASMPVDNYMDLVGNHMSKLPANILQPHILASEVVNYGKHYRQERYRSKLPGILGMYMATTQTGQQYFAKALGQPFHFIVVMYPADKKNRDFLVRPFLIRDNSPVLSTVVLKQHCQHMMQIDMQHNKPYFKYLPKRNVFSDVG